MYRSGIVNQTMAYIIPVTRNPGRERILQLYSSLRFFGNRLTTRASAQEARTLSHRLTSTRQDAHIRSHGDRMIREPFLPGADLIAQPEGASGRQGPTPVPGCPPTPSEAAQQLVLSASSLQTHSHHSFLTIKVTAQANFVSPAIPPLSMVDLRQGAAVKGYCLSEVCQIEGAGTPRPCYRTGLFT